MSDYLPVWSMSFRLAHGVFRGRLPGLFCPCGAVSLAEPPRGMVSGRPIAGTAGVGETLAYLWQKNFSPYVPCRRLTAFVGYGFVTWAPAFLIRSFGMGTGEIGTWFGLILGIGGIGIVMGGWLADKFGAKDPNGISGPPLRSYW